MSSSCVRLYCAVCHFKLILPTKESFSGEHISWPVSFNSIIIHAWFSPLVRTMFEGFMQLKSTSTCWWLCGPKESGIQQMPVWNNAALCVVALYDDDDFHCLDGNWMQEVKCWSIICRLHLDDLVLMKLNSIKYLNDNVIRLVVTTSIYRKSNSIECAIPSWLLLPENGRYGNDTNSNSR